VIIVTALASAGGAGGSRGWCLEQQTGDKRMSMTTCEELSWVYVPTTHPCRTFILITFLGNTHQSSLPPIRLGGFIRLTAGELLKAVAVVSFGVTEVPRSCDPVRKHK